MKTPDEIKKGLKCCIEGGPYCCDECPYGKSGCADDVNLQDALALIRQLERERDAAEKDLEDALDLIIKLALILKEHPRAETNGCAYKAYAEIKRFTDGLRGVQEVE